MRNSETSGEFGPLLDVGPVPGGSSADGPCGVGEAEAAVAPLVDGFAGDAEAVGDLDDADGVTGHDLTVVKVLTEVQPCRHNGYMRNQTWADLQSKCDELVAQWREQGCVDLTDGFIDIRNEHDPITGTVLEDVA